MYIVVHERAIGKMPDYHFSLRKRYILIGGPKKFVMVENHGNSIVFDFVWFESNERKLKLLTDFGFEVIE